MALKLITAPATEPVTALEMEAQVRADLSAEKDLVEGFIAAIRQRCENDLRRALVTQEWELVLDAFPPHFGKYAKWNAIEIPLPPLQSVEFVKYLNGEGVLTTLIASDYVVDLDSTPGKVTPAYGKTWPVTLNYPGAVRIAFTTGYGDAADVPQCVKNWIMLNVASLYENRETVVIGNGGVIDLSTLADSLLDPERWEVRV